MLTRLELLPPAPPHLHSEPALIIAISRPPKTMAFTLENFSGSLWTTLPALLIAFVLSAYVFKPVNPPPPASPMTDPLPKTTSADASAGTSTDGTGEKKAFAVPDALPPPKDEQFTLEDLKKFDGTDASLPIYLSIKGARYLVYSYTPQLTAPIPFVLQAPYSTSVQSARHMGQVARTTSLLARTAHVASASRLSRPRTPLQTGAR